MIVQQATTLPLRHSFTISLDIYSNVIFNRLCHTVLITIRSPTKITSHVVILEAILQAILLTIDKSVSRKQLPFFVYCLLISSCLEASFLYIRFVALLHDSFSMLLIVDIPILTFSKLIRVTFNWYQGECSTRSLVRKVRIKQKCGIPGEVIELSALLMQ